ncbi:YciI family protein [Kribbella sp. NPDC026611]|uniref:YciI family protein n=1 Tax=Kribbella sp. NPDC026611 TaxID=3154911 RepID=UPI0033CF7535
MPEYLIAFNNEWVSELTDFERASREVRALRAEMESAGVLIYTGGLDETAPVFSVTPTTGEPLFTDGPYVESKEHLGGFALITVPDEASARHWAAKVATACGWPQEVHRFRHVTRATTP